MSIEHYKGAVIAISQFRKHKLTMGLFSTTIVKHGGNGCYYEAEIDYHGKTRKTKPCDTEMEALKAAKSMIDNW